MAIIIRKSKIKPAPVETRSTKDKLIALVKQAIADNPREMDGFHWAEFRQPELATLAGCSVATVRNIVSRPPFVREQTHTADGRRVTLLRIGKPGEKTERHIANIMRKIYRKQTGQQRVPDSAYGCLIGLAKDLPAGHQIEIFKLAVKQWHEFVAGFHLALDVGEIDIGGKPVKHMKMHKPHIPTLRLGWKVAVELYQMHLQKKAAGKKVALADIPY